MWIPVQSHEKKTKSDLNFDMNVFIQFTAKTSNFNWLFYALVVDFAHILDNIPHIGLVHPIIMLDMC